MKKLILLMLVFWAVLGVTYSRAEEVKYSTLEVSGVVTSVSPVEIRITQKYARNRYVLYTFKITRETKIVGLVQKRAFVRVKYLQNDTIVGSFIAAQEIQVLHAPNAYFQRMY